MSIQFFPLGIPFSSSFAVNAGITFSTPTAGFPTTTSLAEFSINNIGPTGSNFLTISGSKVTII